MMAAARVGGMGGARACYPIRGDRSGVRHKDSSSVHLRVQIIVDSSFRTSGWTPSGNPTTNPQGAGIGPGDQVYSQGYRLERNSTAEVRRAMGRRGDRRQVFGRWADSIRSTVDRLLDLGMAYANCQSQRAQAASVAFAASRFIDSRIRAGVVQRFEINQGGQRSVCVVCVGRQRMCLNGGLSVRQLPGVALSNDSGEMKNLLAQTWISVDPNLFPG